MSLIFICTTGNFTPESISWRKDILIPTQFLYSDVVLCLAAHLKGLEYRKEWLEDILAQYARYDGYLDLYAWACQTYTNLEELSAKSIRDLSRIVAFRKNNPSQSKWLYENYGMTSEDVERFADIHYSFMRYCPGLVDFVVGMRDVGISWNFSNIAAQLMRDGVGGVGYGYTWRLVEYANGAHVLDGEIVMSDNKENVRQHHQQSITQIIRELWP